MGCDNFIVSEQEVLAQAACHNGPVVVDLDETLYLQNSTADFLDCAVPGVVALLLLKCLDLIAPWRWTGGQSTRDGWRVRLVMALFPWSLARWRARCREHAAALTNRPLLEALRARGRPFIVATNGFEPLVQPLLTAMGCPEVQLIACHLDRPSDRIGGKAALIEASIGSPALAEALFITDSADDADVLNRCRQPCLTRWAAARFQRPFQRVYLPGLYTALVKRVSGFNQTLVNQLFWLIIPLTTGHFNSRTLVAAIPFFWSFWAVYEAGYRDNDLCAAKYEEDPVLSPTFAGFRQAHFELKAWLFAIVLGTVAILILRAAPDGWLAVAWLAFLVVTRLTFWIYNRLDKVTRVWVYPLLALQREAGFLIFAAANAAGMSAVLARALAKWIEYIVYRYARTVGVKGFPTVPLKTYRVVLFVVLIAGAAVASPSANDATFLPSAALLFLLYLGSARQQIMAIFRSGRRIDRVPDVGSSAAVPAVIEGEVVAGNSQ